MRVQADRFHFLPGDLNLILGHARGHQPTAQQRHWAARWILTV